jgi:IrrE N-terminal-like domain
MFAEPNQQLSIFEQVQMLDPTLSDEEAVIRVCEDILGAVDAKPPIQVEVIASLRGIARIERRDQPWAGVLVPTASGGLEVSVRATDAYERQRFTICHEAGHTLFPGFHEQRRYRCNGEKTRLEQLCDCAAGELLLPRRIFSADLAKASFDWESVEELHWRYEASIEATANRVVDLWPGDDVALLVLHERHKPAERGREDEFPSRLRLDYAHTGSGTWPFVRRHKSASDDSPLVAAMFGEDVSDIASLDEFFGSSLGPVEVHARRFGGEGRVLALVRRPPFHRGRKTYATAT